MKVAYALTIVMLGMVRGLFVHKSVSESKMGKPSRSSGIQARLDALTRKWWFYLLLLLVFFIPTYASQSYDPRNSIELIGQVLSDPILFGFPVLMPIAKIIPLILIIGVMVFGNRWRLAFTIYVAALYLALAFFQTTAVTAQYGLVILSGNLALILVVALIWFWEVFARQNDFEPRQRPLWRWWVAPVALVAFLSPADSSSMSPIFNPVLMLTNEAGLTFCMMTPVILAFLTLFHPTLNQPLLRISSFAGIIFGVINLLVWFIVNPWGWWMGVLHIPLLVISIYAFILGNLAVEKVLPNVIPA